MREEQAEELEVLRSIYAENLEELSEAPPSVRLNVDAGLITITLTFTFPEDYPYVVPEIIVECSRGKFPELEKLKADLNSEAERNLGMAMIYTLLSFTEEAISNHVHLIASKKADFKVKVQEDILDQKKFEGTPVTVERFHEWNKKFLEEMRKLKEAEEKRKIDLNNKKLTGRQLFEQNKVLASSDTTFYDESGINVDEAIFEGLGDLNIDEEGEETDIEACES